MPDAGPKDDSSTEPAAGTECWFWATRTDLAVCSALLVAAVAALALRHALFLQRQAATRVLEPDDVHVVLDINAAPAHALEELPGIGPALASRIVADRRERGPYRSLRDLLRVHGMGEGLLRRITPDIRVGGSADPSDPPAPESAGNAAGAPIDRPEPAP
jgi:competence protein ComEA